MLILFAIYIYVHLYITYSIFVCNTCGLTPRTIAPSFTSSSFIYSRTNCICIYQPHIYRFESLKLWNLICTSLQTHTLTHTQNHTIYTHTNRIQSHNRTEWNWVLWGQHMHVYTFMGGIANATAAPDYLACSPAPTMTPAAPNTHAFSCPALCVEIVYGMYFIYFVWSVSFCRELKRCGNGAKYWANKIA